MDSHATVYLFGSLRGADGNDPQHRIQLSLRASMPLGDLLADLGISPEKVGLAMVNHVAAPRDHLIRPGDRVSLFPRDYAIFTDWKDFRSPFLAK